MKPLHSSQILPHVSPEMIAAGVQVLRESGVLFAESSADQVVVRRILERALLIHTPERQSSSEQPLAPQIPNEP